MNKRRNNAVSEIIGTILLLLIAVSVFTVIYFTVLSNQDVSSGKIVNIVGTVEGKNIILEHRGGQPIDLDARISYTLNQTSYSFLVSDFLEESAKLDNKWKLGERCYIPFEYDIDYLEQYDSVEVTAMDVESNSLVFIGTLELNPMSDLSVEATFNPEEPSLNQDVTITIVATCRGGDVGARSINIRCLLPEGLKHNWNTTTKGSYSNSSGIWFIDKIDIGENATLTINAKITLIEKRLFTQLSVLLDGSGSISSTDWNIMRTGLANAVANNDVFPRDESVELNVVQFGGGLGNIHARKEIDPLIVSESNCGMVSSNINSIVQMQGATPTSCAIHLGTDTIYESENYDSENRNVLILVTDGKANCEWIPGGYTGDWDGNGWIQSTSQSYTGTVSAHATTNRDGAFISQNIDTSNATALNIGFYYRLSSYIGSGDLELYFYNGEDYNFIEDLGTGSKDTWLNKQYTITDSQYFHSDFNIKFYSRLGWSRSIWIDDVTIDAGDSVFFDSFESPAWNKYWTDPGKQSADEAREYMVSTLEMNESKDEFSSLAVGPDPDIYWLNNSIAFPQPGYQAPPYDQGTGWVNHISSYSEFEVAITEIFKTIFESRVTIVNIEQVEPIDPNPYNTKVQISITPKD
ncbi:MAG: VWA domain-containing protein [Thermoplasmatota archaeon]